ncbi:unnamed protein product [Rangifer tarandus platyrhynchus]|uniref:Uncharacterized protein n=2 Tax=Rangifer tarandus platyrhynchus TaxID=3082113 RepID=A0ABN8ZRF3_RANTA|nr:unnamed protein product [Rangifer tarandus platyrhynchus]CAI9709341.1 unnamed protein product [Rangifer tarandus platyrhynchus]
MLPSTPLIRAIWSDTGDEKGRRVGFPRSPAPSPAPPRHPRTPGPPPPRFSRKALCGRFASSARRCARFDRFVRCQPGSASRLELRTILRICGFHDVSLRGPALFSYPGIFFFSFPPLSPFPPFPLSPPGLRPPSPAPARSHTPPPLGWHPRRPVRLSACGQREPVPRRPAAPGRRGWAGGGVGTRGNLEARPGAACAARRMESPNRLPGPM